MKEQAMAAEAGQVVVDGRGGGVEDAGDLAVGGAGNGVFLDLDEELGAFEPVRGAKGLVGEGASAGLAAVTSDDKGGVAAAEDAEADDRPGLVLGLVVVAVRVGAVGRQRMAGR